MKLFPNIFWPRSVALMYSLHSQYKKNLPFLNNTDIRRMWRGRTKQWAWQWVTGLGTESWIFCSDHTLIPCAQHIGNGHPAQNKILDKLCLCVHVCVCPCERERERERRTPLWYSYNREGWDTSYCPVSVCVRVHDHMGYVSASCTHLQLIRAAGSSSLEMKTIHLNDTDTHTLLRRKCSQMKQTGWCQSHHDCRWSIYSFYLLQNGGCCSKVHHPLIDLDALDVCS